MKEKITSPHWVVLSFVDLTEQGAPRTHILEFCRALKQYASVTMLNPTPAEEVESDGWRYIYISAPYIGRKERFWNIPLFAIAAVICLWRLHRHKPIDVLYIRDDPRATSAVLWAKFLPLRCVDGCACPETGGLAFFLECNRCRHFPFCYEKLSDDREKWDIPMKGIRMHKPKNAQVA